MDPLALKERIAEIGKPLDAVEVSGDLTPERRAKIAADLDQAAAEAEREVLAAARASDNADARDEAARLYRRLAQSNSWLEGREARTREWIDRAAELAASDVLRDLVVSEQNRMRDTEAFAGLSELCQQGRVDKARRTLKARRKRTTDPVMRKRIDEFLAEPRNFLAPIKSAPAMVTYNGIGTRLVGERARRADGTYVATLCLVFLFIPVLPLRSYLVRNVGQGWSFFGRVPLSPFAFWWRRIAVLGPMFLALMVWAKESWDSSPMITEGRLLASAQESLDRRDYTGALRTLQRVSNTRDAGRTARMNELTRKVYTAALAEVRQSVEAEAFLRTVGNIPPGLRPPRVDAEVEAAAEAALERLTAPWSFGKSVRPFIEWMASLSSGLAARLPEAVARACARIDDPALLAEAADLHARAGRPCPAAFLSRLAGHLLKARHESWAADALSYLRAAEPAEARAVLLARAEGAWKGVSPGNDLVPLKGLPEPLRALLALDAEPDLEKRAAGLERISKPAGLEEAHENWHRLGIARRLSKLYGTLNEKDPLRFPVSKAHPWAIQAAELAPDDAEARLTALHVLLQDGDFARAVALGSAHLADPKTALLVGIAHARSAKPEEAAKLLRPLVERDLPEFTKALGEWEKAVASRSDELWRSLERGYADRSFIARLNSLPKDRAAAEAQKWVHQRVESDPRIAELARAWRGRKEVHPAASELAMIELELGRALPPGPGRQERLQSAERLFIELRKVMHDDPHQELQLGQVYFWLGKEKEGTEIFDRLEAAEGTKLLHAMGEVYRELSRMDAARRVLEKAYDKAGADEKKSIALTRALSSNASEDKLVWLKKGDTSNPRIRADLDQLEAEVALERGGYSEAVEPLRRAAAYYAGLPENQTSHNNASILQWELALATGDSKYLLEALRLMRRAHEASPEDAIVLGNYVDDLEKVGLAALAGTALRMDLLHEEPGWAWLDYMQPLPSPQEWAQKAKIQPELRRAAELGARAVVLSPDGRIGYRAQSSYYWLIRDGPAYRRLRESVEQNPPARREAAGRAAAHAKGEYTESERKSVERQLARWETILPSLRKGGHAPTLAYALGQSASSRLSAFHMGMPGQTVEAAAREIEEAVGVFDAYPTRHTLAWIRAYQAAQAVAADSPEFARWIKENPSVHNTVLLPLYLRKNPERAKEIGGREDVRRAAQAIADLMERFPDRRLSVSNWAWLDLTDHSSKERARQALHADPILLESELLDRLLNPGSPSAEADAWLAAEACGEKELAAKIASKARATGVLPLFFGE